MTYLVEITYPYAVTDQHDECFECASVEQLALGIDEATGWGERVCLGIAVDVGRGEDFEHEFDSGRTVAARRAESAVIA